MENDVQTTFLKISEFNDVVGRLTFEDAEILDKIEGATEGDSVAIEFTINSDPLVKNLSLISGGDFTSYWKGRFKKEGVDDKHLKEAFSIAESNDTPSNERPVYNR